MVDPIGGGSVPTSDSLDYEIPTNTDIPTREMGDYERPTQEYVSQPNPEYACIKAVAGSGQEQVNK